MKDFLNDNKKFITLIVPAIFIFLLGFFSGRVYLPEEAKVKNVVNKNSSEVASVDFDTFWKAWNIINEKYVPTNGTSTEKVSDQARIWGAIKGMTDSLGDPYTTFFPPVESKHFEEEISGNFEGVGMEVGIRDSILTVIAPLKGTPAYRAGIKSGDKIVKIGETLTTKMSADEAVKLIRGKKGTVVKFTVIRDGVEEPIEISVIRDVIDIPTIDTEIKDNVFIIHLYNFSAISANLFRESMREFVESGKSKMIIDVRGNPGGYLEAAIDMASWFLPAGKTVVKEDFRDEKDAQVYRSKGYNIFSDQLKLIVLVDGGSASASEILAGALQENGRATVLGTQSFGKGSVQELIKITDETSLKVTIAKWLTPEGHSISNGGITPDVVVKFDPEQYKNGLDTQIQEAIKILNSQ